MTCPAHDPHYDNEAERDQDRHDDDWATEMARLDRLEDHTPHRLSQVERDAMRILFDLMTETP